MTKPKIAYVSNDAITRVNERGYSVVISMNNRYLVSKETAQYVADMRTKTENYTLKIRYYHKYEN